MRLVTVFLCRPRGQHGFIMLKALVDAGRIPAAIVIEEPRLANAGEKSVIEKVKMVYEAEGFKGVIKAVASKIPPLGALLTEKRCFTEDDIVSLVDSFNIEKFMVKDHNSSETQEILKKIAPDILIVGGTKILSGNILEVPRIGTLNVHPGYLPEFRGVDVIPWALYYGKHPHVSVHFVDRGVDTGDIISKKPIPLERADTLCYLEIKAMRKGAEMLIEAVDDLLNGRVKALRQSKNEGRQYYRMSYKDRLVAERNLKKMTSDEAT